MWGRVGGGPWGSCVEPEVRVIKARHLVGALLACALSVSACGGGGGDGTQSAPDALVLVFRRLPAQGTQVNTDFSVTVGLQDAVSGEPVVPDPPLLITLLRGSGAGALSGSSSQEMIGSEVIFSGLQYDEPDTLHLLAASGRTTPQTSIGIKFDIDIVGAPGPFVALATTRVGQGYADRVDFAAPGALQFGVLEGALPAGLSLDRSTGALSGAATAPGSHAFTLYARTDASTATPIRCALAVFSSNESEILVGQDFSQNGSLSTVSTAASTGTFQSSFDSTSYTTGLRIYHPAFASISSPLPLYVHHRGRGFNYLDYDNLLHRIASHGFICVSVEDYQSFFSPSTPAPITQYDTTRSELGMQSASAFQEAALRYMLERSASTGDVFFGTIDATRVFVGGHSRGGGATQGSHVRALDLQLRGVIYLMPFDLRVRSNTRPPGVAPAYAIPNEHPRLPCLAIMGENDGDLVFPFADQLIERATGQMTSVTLYGGNHNYVGDSNGADGSPYITRSQQLAAISNQMVAFLKRWSDLDLSLEGFCYGDQFAGSSAVGVTTNRNLAASLLIDDFQGGSTGTNALGGANTVSGATRSEVSFYPSLGDLASLGIRQSRLVFNSTAASFSTAIPASQSTAGRQRLLFRSAQTSSIGYDWVTFDVRITDASGQQATVRLFDRSAQDDTYLPDKNGGGDPRTYDRFVDVQVRLSEFQAANPSIDLDNLRQVAFVFDFASVPSAGRQVYLDDIRLE